MDHIFLDTEPAHKRYGYGSLKIGGIVSIPCNKDEVIKIRSGISSHAQHRNKKFKTRTLDGIMYVKRIA